MRLSANTESRCGETDGRPGNDREGLDGDGEVQGGEVCARCCGQVPVLPDETNTLLCQLKKKIKKK